MYSPMHQISLATNNGHPRELYIAKAAGNCGFLLVVPIISRTPTKDISPPYVNSETTFYTKKRASDQFSEAPLIFFHIYPFIFYQTYFPIIYLLVLRA